MIARIVLGVALLALGGWFLLSVFVEDKGGDASSGVVRAFTSSEQCKECHPQVYEEWVSSPHAHSWTNERVRALSNDFANQDCIDCHAPRPVFEVGLENRPLPREERRVEGVDCLTCHDLGGGQGVAGTMTDPRAACKPVERIELTRVTYCGFCHNQHKTIDQWMESDYPAQDQDCLHCHMPYRDGDPNLGRSHAMPGGTSIDYLRRAVTMDAEYVDGNWVVVLENVGAGHAFPTDERSRAADLFWRPLDAPEPPEGQTNWRHFHRIRDPYRTETDIPRTLLDAHEVRRIEVPEGDGSIEVALFYKRSPFYRNHEQWNPDEESDIVQVHRLELVP